MRAKKRSVRKAEAAANDPLAILQVLDRLEVGPVVVTPRKLTAPYRVFKGRRRNESELVYRFEEDVFEPGDAGSENLAAMIVAQVALNYGLFCGELVFRGPYDRHDRRFLAEMARNTAREIYVKKFLEPNPFLRGAAAELPVVKRDSYLLAALRFVDPEPAAAGDPERSERIPQQRQATGRGWGVDLDRLAVLSSGGKDSLLSHGILDELGKESHPIFINESGRHWFTALNAYRHFREHVPHTGRVWTNSDRLFAWMLRQLPFIRSDFASVRSDEYPIRLWTVAVFLFGALPLLRKRGIGRLVIGDEYDTTERSSHQGVTHYDGLFDQSRYFDNALTRYFHRKGWGVSQFSVLRPLSELLIQKMLTVRYPDLQQHQVSCHATHVIAERVHPCGRCEKCRRIVGMLTAMGGDPTRCGYTPQQIEDCLQKLAGQRIHQESDGAEHLIHLLSEMGVLTGVAVGRTAARARPHVMKLRIDKERSPFDTIPSDLRESVFQIMLEHTAGAVRRSGRIWIDFDPLADPGFGKPYLFEKPVRVETHAGTGKNAGEGDRSPDRHDHLLAELTWPEARKRFQEVDLAMLPVGAMEQHGPHLPLDTDAFDADFLARRVAELCSEPRPLVLPLMPYGVSYHHDDFSGTLSVSPDTLSRVVYDVGIGVARHGITKLVIVNGHGGNGPALHFAAQLINRDAHIFTCVETGETSDLDVAAMIHTSNDVHAGETETSTTLATRPGLVDMTEASPCVPSFSSRFLDFTSRRSVGWYAYTNKISPSGVLGDPTRASVEKGDRIWEVMIRRLVEFVEDLKNMSLEEIHQRRY
ncbi:MAG: creatininase family protein [bacterium]